MDAATSAAIAHCQCSRALGRFDVHTATRVALRASHAQVRHSCDVTNIIRFHALPFYDADHDHDDLDLDITLTFLVAFDNLRPFDTELAFRTGP